MDPRSRAAVIQRWQAIAGNDPCPTSWDQLTVTQQLTIENLDPQLAAIFKGQIDSQTELDLISGKLSASYDGPSLDQQEAAARQQYFDEAEQRMADEIARLAAANAAKVGAQTIDRAESLMVANAALAAQSAASRGW